MRLAEFAPRAAAELHHLGEGLGDDPFNPPTPAQIAKQGRKLSTISRKRGEEARRHSRRMAAIGSNVPVSGSTPAANLTRAAAMTRASERRRDEIERHNSKVADLADQQRDT